MTTTLSFLYFHHHAGHTDVHFVKNDLGLDIVYPLTPGHEARSSTGWFYSHESSLP